jgi:hypothetical protein
MENSTGKNLKSKKNDRIEKEGKGSFVDLPINHLLSPPSRVGVLSRFFLGTYVDDDLRRSWNLRSK